MPSRARRERQKQRSIQRKKRLQLTDEAQHLQQLHGNHSRPFMPASSSSSSAAAAAIPTGYSDPRHSTPGVPSSIPGSHQSHFNPSPALFAHPEPLEWTPAYDSFLVLDVEATCMDIPRGTSFQHGPPPTTPLQSTIPLSSSSSSSASSHHPQHQHRLSVGGQTPGPSSFGPSSFASNNGPTLGTPASTNTSLTSPTLYPVPNSPLLSPMTSSSPLPSASPSQSFGRHALVDYPNEIIEFPVILMQWRDVPPEEGGRPGQRTLQVVDEFHSWVRPAWRPRLSRFCKDLTGVKQNVIDSAPSWPEVMQNFLAFLRKHRLLADNQPPRARSSSIASSASSSPMPFGAFSPASPPVFPMLSSPSPSSHHLPPMMNHAHHPHSHHHPPPNFHFPHTHAQQQQQQPSHLPAPTVEYESLLMTTPLRHGVAWCTHGPYDLRDFAVKSCFLSGLRTPPGPPYWLRGPLIDIRKAAAEILLEERMLRLRSNDAREFAGKECRKAQLARAMMGEPPLLSSRKGKGKETGSGAVTPARSASASKGGAVSGPTSSSSGSASAEDDTEWKRELELDHLLQAYERSVRAWPWYSAAISGQSGRFSANSAGHAVAHAERVKILPDGTIDGILYSLGLGHFHGRKHSGLDDSRNLARILGDMARRVGEVAAGRGTPGWEQGRTDVRRPASGSGKSRRRSGGKPRSRARVAHDDGGIDEAVANLSLESSSSSAEDEEDENDSGSLDEFDDEENSDEDDDDEDEDDGASDGADGESDGLKDGWIGADPDADAETGSGHAFVSTYNDRERQRLCALQGQVFERACLLPNSFWKPLYLPTTVFSPIAATAARLLIWGTGPENRGAGGGTGRNGHRGAGHGAGAESHGPPVPARPIWMEGKRHPWMGPHPGQVFWNGPSIVDDADDGDEVEEVRAGKEGQSDSDSDEDEVFRYPGVSAEALDGTVSDLRAERRKLDEASTTAGGGMANGNTLVNKLLATPKADDTDGDSEIFTYTSSTTSSAAVAAADEPAILLDEPEPARQAFSSSSSRSSSLSRVSEGSNNSDGMGTTGTRPMPIPIPIPGAGAVAVAMPNGGGSGGGGGGRLEHRKSAQLAGGGGASASGGGGGDGRTPSGQRTPVLGSSTATRA
ncbi:hypothetical protein OC834_000260 [Tilletia horrida]|nr:hypothetical protein OC834_000260 [Tilletia horrida]